MIFDTVASRRRATAGTGGCGATMPPHTRPVQPAVATATKTTLRRARARHRRKYCRSIQAGRAVPYTARPVPVRTRKPAPERSGRSSQSALRFGISGVARWLLFRDPRRGQQCRFGNAGHWSASVVERKRVGWHKLDRRSFVNDEEFELVR